MSIEDCLNILELKPGASIEEIKTARIEMLQVWHPDKFASNPHLSEKARQKTLKINEAFSVLVKEFNLQEQEIKRRRNSDAGVYGKEDYRKEFEQFSKKQKAKLKYKERRQTQTSRAKRQLSFTLLGCILTGLFGVVLGLDEWSFVLALLVLPVGLFISLWTYRKPIKKRKSSKI